MTTRIFVFLLLISGVLARAGNVETNARIEAPALYNTGANLTVFYDKLSSLGVIQPSVSYGLIEFGMDERKKVYHAQAFTSVISFTYNASYTNFTTATGLTQSLVVNFDPVNAYKPQAFYKEGNAVMLAITKMDVKTYQNYGLPGQTLITNPADLFVEAGISTEEPLVFNFSSALPVASQMGYNLITVGTQTTELQAYWGYLYGAEAYELEYIYVDDYDASGVYATGANPANLPYDFAHDATRIITSNQYYSIPVIYERGYILFRVRGIGRSKTNNGARLEGTWSNTGFESGFVSTYLGNTALSGQVYAVAGAHQNDEVNWSCVRTFDENGKSGTGVSYEDGLLKNRQTVAKLNTDNKTIVQSTLYDWQGRPAVSVLPSPVTDAYLSYKPNMNMYAAGTAFDKNVFDNQANFVGGSACVPNGFSMSSVHSNGAAKYYSPNNPDKEQQQGLIPDAQGKPFVQVEYYPDQTGRIKKQSVPGGSHYIGSGHEMQFYYAQPSQQELCRLFGTEVGHYDEYEKNIVVDPNGQISVSYHDDEGRVIASGLYGANPSNLLPIEGAVTSSAVITTTLVNNVNDPVNYTYELSNTFFAAQGETQLINYNVTVPVISNSCTPNLCLDCVYELQISVKDDCGAEVIDSDPATPGNQPYTTFLGRYTPGATPAFTTSCPSSTAALQFSMGTPTVPIAFNVPKTGTYHVNKKLQLSSLPLSYYAQQYVTTNTCLTTLSTFQNEALQDIDITNCTSFDCSSCSTSVMNAVSALTFTLSQAQIDALIEKCQLKCDMQNICTSREKLMRSYFKPGGYFAKYNTAGTVTPPSTTISYTTSSIYSIFNPGNSLNTILNIQPNTSVYNYSAVPAPGYSTYTVYSQQQQAAVSPSVLSIGEHVALYATPFSDPWVKWHPEYCKLQFYCDGLTSAITAYETLIKNCVTYNDACQKGLLYPFPSAIGVTAAPVASASCPSGCTPVPNQYIPLVAFGGSSNFSASQISAALSAFTGSFLSTTYSTPGSTVTANLYQFAVAGSQSVAISSNMPHLGSSGCDLDLGWQLYKGMYLSLIQNLLADLRATYLASWTPAQGGCLSASQLAALPNYIKVFEDPSPTGPFTVPPVSSTSISVLVSNISGSMAAMCHSYCVSYVNNWVNDLSGCSIPPATWNLMQNDMVAVCEANCGGSNPYGASTAVPSITISVSGTTYSVGSFQDVLSAYGYSPTANCNAYLISWPPPAGSPFPGGSPNSGGPGPAGTPTLDACSCDKIKQTHDAYVAGVAAATINPCVLSETAYFQAQLGVTLPYLSSYTCICSQAYVGPGQYNFAQVTSVPSTSFAAFPVPPQLACKNCIPCRNIENIYNQLQATFGTTVTANINQTALLNYLNQTFGVTSTLTEWLSFIDDCKRNMIGNPPGATYVGSFGVPSITSPPAFAIGTLLNTLQSQGFLALNTAATAYTLNQGNAATFFASALWTLPNVPSATAAVVVNVNPLNSQELDIKVYNAPLSYSCTFTVPLPSPLTPANLSTQQSLGFATIAGRCDQAAFGSKELFGKITYYDPVSNLTYTHSVIVRNTCFVTTTPPPVGGLPQCEPYLCGQGLPAAPSLSNSCMSTLINNALNTAQTNYNNYLNQAIAAFLADYKNTCYAGVSERFTRGYTIGEYQYTLNYYDRAGNLVHTVPPASVQVLSGSSLTTAVQYVVNQGTVGTAVYPAHSLNQSTGINSYVSHYAYTTFDTPLKQISPDAGETVYFYDYVGRLVASQNQKQAPFGLYSYTLYDDWGRITEVGELVVGTIMGSSLTETIAANPYLWQNYVNSYARRDISHMYYDAVLNPTVSAYFSGGPQYLQNRISSATYEYTNDNNPHSYVYGTHYSYDDHGNVKTLINERYGEYIKTLDYSYDLVSGNVNKVSYNKGKADQYYHKYTYDRDNRLKEVYTSKTDVVYERDAKYHYYQHGPMARTELGEQQVQGSDYAFTIQGWVKAVNSNALSAATDMGKDGSGSNAYLSSQSGLHGNFAKDAAGYSLNYFSGDYNPIKAAAGNFLADLSNLNHASASGFKLSADAPDLYNGNISSMVSSITEINPLSKDRGLAKPQIAGYRYDQLQRIRHMKTFASLCVNAGSTAEHKEAIDLSANQFTIPVNNSNYIGAYEMDFIYDKLGNLKTLERNGEGVYSGGSWQRKQMDKLTYHYQNGANLITSIGTIQQTNRLTHVSEDVSIPGGNYPTDIEDQLPNNYNFDAAGQLTGDAQEEIANIEWTAAHKVKRITRSSGSTKPDIVFDYNAFGQRVSKTVYYKDDNGQSNAGDYKQTRYELDASGLVVAIDEQRSTVSGSPPLQNVTVQLSCKEQMVYGAGRLGETQVNIVITTNISQTVTSYGFERWYGQKVYELSNHLGNVQSTVSDRKRAIDGEYSYAGYTNGNYSFDGYTYASVSAGTGIYTQVSAPDGVVDSYVADIRTVADYYAFGLTMPGRTQSVGGSIYRYGMNGQEQEEDVLEGATSAEYWMYDSRLGRRWEMDPLAYDWQSPYATFNNNPIYYSDPSGLEPGGPGGGGDDKGKKKENKGPDKATQGEIDKHNRTHKDTEAIYDPGTGTMVIRPKGGHTISKESKTNPEVTAGSNQPAPDKKDKNPVTKDPVKENKENNGVVVKVIKKVKTVGAAAASVSTMLNANSAKRVKNFGPKIQPLASRAKAIATGKGVLKKAVKFSIPYTHESVDIGAKYLAKTAVVMKPLVRMAPIIGGVALVAEVTVTGKVTAGNVVTGVTIAAGATAVFAVAAAPAVAAAAAVVGTVYLVGNLISLITTGESIETHVNNAVDKAGYSVEKGGTLIK